MPTGRSPPDRFARMVRELERFKEEINNPKFQSGKIELHFSGDSIVVKFGDITTRPGDDKDRGG